MGAEGGSVLSGLLWKFGERACAQLVSFAVSVVLARLLAPRAFGLVAMVNIFIAIADVLVTDSLSSSLVQKRDADRLDFDSVFWITLGISVLAYGAVFLLAPAVAAFYGEPELSAVLRVFALKLPVSALNSVQHAYVSRHMEFRKFFFSTLVGTVLSGAVGISMALAGCGVWALIGQYLSNSCVDCAVLLFTVPWRPRPSFSAERARGLFSYGWKVLLTQLISSVYGQLRGFVIGRVYDADDLAHYNMGERIPGIFTGNVDTAIVSVLFPAMSNVGDDRASLRSMTRRSMRLSAYVIFPLMAGLAVVSRPLVLLVLTEKWLPCVFFLRLFCIEKATSPFSTANLQAIKASGRSDVLLGMEIAKKTVGIVAVLLSIPFGLRAIACSGLVTAFIAVLVNTVPNGRLIGYSMRSQLADVAPVALLTAGMSAVAWGARRLLEGAGAPLFATILLTALAGAAAYVGLSKAFRVPEYGELVGMLRRLAGRG